MKLAAWCWTKDCFFCWSICNYGFLIETKIGLQIEYQTGLIILLCSVTLHKLKFGEQVILIFLPSSGCDKVYCPELYTWNRAVNFIIDISVLSMIRGEFRIKEQGHIFYCVSFWHKIDPNRPPVWLSIEFGLTVI